MPIQIRLSPLSLRTAGAWIALAASAPLAAGCVTAHAQGPQTTIVQGNSKLDATQNELQ